MTARAKLTIYRGYSDAQSGNCRTAKRLKTAAAGDTTTGSTKGRRREALDRDEEMKKAKKATRIPVAESGAKPTTIDEYLARVPEPGRSTLQEIRTIIKAAVPRDATETISYGIPAFRHKEVLIWFAAFAGHCSLFPTGAMIEQFKDELKDYTVSKGTIQFPLNKPLPSSLLKRMVKARLAYITAKNRR